MAPRHFLSEGSSSKAFHKWTKRLGSFSAFFSSTGGGSCKMSFRSKRVRTLGKSSLQEACHSWKLKAGGCRNGPLSLPSSSSPSKKEGKMVIVASSGARRRLARRVGLGAGSRPTDSEEESKSKPMHSVGSLARTAGLMTTPGVSAQTKKKRYFYIANPHVSLF